MDFWKQFKKDTFVPSGFMAIPDAFDLVGRTIYEDEHWGKVLWTGREAGYELPLGKDERDRREAVFRWMHKRASGGRMLFYFFHEGRSALMGRDLWNVPEAVAFKRFELCAVDMAPYLPGPAQIPFPVVMMAEKHSLLHDLADLRVGPSYPEGTNTEVEGALENIRALRAKKAVKPATAPATTPAPPEIPQGGFVAAPPLSKWVGKEAADHLADMHSIARIAWEKKCTLHRAAHLWGEANLMDITVNLRERRVSDLYKKTREIYHNKGVAKTPSERKED